MGTAVADEDPLPTRARVERFKKRVSKALRYWQIQMGIGTWSITISWILDGSMRTGKNGEMCVLGRCKSDWMYMRATIEFNVVEAIALNDKDLEELIVHELYHAVVNELRETDGYNDHEERVVSLLTASAFWMRSAAEDGRARPLVKGSKSKKKVRRAR